MFLKMNGKSVAVDMKGEGKPILLVHGLGGSSNFWTPVVAEFSKDFKVVVPDLPSSARSEKDENISIESLAKDAFTLMDKLEIEDAHVGGHSMGTIVCQHMAAMRPERVLDLVLLGPLAEPSVAARRGLKDRAEIARTQGKVGMTQIADRISDSAVSRETKGSRPNAVGFIREMVIRQDPESYALSCMALANAQRAPASDVTCRTLLITGDEDGVALPADVEKLNRVLADSEMHILSGCGHWTATEKPEEVNRLIRKFYKR